jgi:hypothetical protein
MTKYYLYTPPTLSKRLIIFLDKNNERDFGISYFFERETLKIGSVPWTQKEMRYSRSSKPLSYNEVINLIGKRKLTEARKMVAEELLEYA